MTVPTFRRPAQILETLASLQQQQTTRRFAVILIENEAEKREGAIAATPLFESGAVAGNDHRRPRARQLLRLQCGV